MLLLVLLRPLLLLVALVSPGLLLWCPPLDLGCRFGCRFGFSLPFSFVSGSELPRGSCFYRRFPLGCDLGFEWDFVPGSNSEFDCEPASGFYFGFVSG